MNILIIFPHGNALNRRGGAEIRVWNIITTLVNNDFNVTILHSKNSIGFEDKELKKRCEVYYYKELNYFSRSDWYITDINPFFILKLLSIIRKQKYDIIQIEYPWGFFTTKFLKKKGSLLIYDSLGVESEFIKIAFNHPNFPTFLKPITLMLTKYYEKLVCKLSDYIINVTYRDRNYYIRNYNIIKSKTVVIQIPSSLEIKATKNREIIKKECRLNLGLPLNKKIIIFHGSLPHPPNQEAINIIENYIAPKFVDNDILFALAGFNLKKYNKKNVVSLGFVENLKDFLLSADFAIIPLVSGEGQRVKCADYIVTGIPFICTKKSIEGIDFLKNGHNCLIYNTVNKDFLRGIMVFCKDKKLRVKIQNNLSKISYKVNKEYFSKRLISFYRKLLG